MKKLHILIAVAGLLAVAAGVGYAAIPGANGTINACKDARGGLKVIDVEAGQTCKSDQQLLTWNQQGPQGPAGPQGPQGPAGEPGDEVQYINVAVDGSLFNTNWQGTLNITHPGPGTYELQFAEPVWACSRWVGFTNFVRMSTTGNIGTQGTTIRVRTYDHTATLADSAFTLQLAC